MEVFLYNSTVCRLCGEENDNGSFLYLADENRQNLSELVNAYLPIQVSDDGQLPRTICPGCTIQLEATVEFITLISNGQKTIRSLYEREKEYKKTMLKSAEEINGVNVVEVNETSAYSDDHPMSLQVAGLERPKRKRGRPPKKTKTPEEIALEAAKEAEAKKPKIEWKEEERAGKRRRKTPERFKEVVQGKELEKIFLEEGVIDGEDDMDVKPDKEDLPKEQVLKIPEVIGHTDTGELVVVVKGKGRGRPRGRLRASKSECAICGASFTCSGRYMSHVAQHGPVVYACATCGDSFTARYAFNQHQECTGHSGTNIIHTDNKQQTTLPDPTAPIPDTIEQESSDLVPVERLVENATNNGSLPELNPQPLDHAPDIQTNTDTDNNISVHEVTESPSVDGDKDKSNPESPSKVKNKLKCPHCDKRYSSKQSKSLHIKAAHRGERAYVCGECGSRFAYPRALALHKLAHQRRRPNKGFACDLCGKVLNHPSSVAYHKEAEHAGQRYVCNKCGKSFKHRQLLQRHQLVHSHHRPYSCKVCTAKFKTKANLINHQLLHSGVKKFSCDICKQKFAHKTSLTLHVRWHNGQKPYVCKVCNKAFSQKGNLSEHARIHTGEKPFQCALCTRRFTTSSQLRLHLRRHQKGSAGGAEGDRARAVTNKHTPVTATTVITPTLNADINTYSKFQVHSQGQKQMSLLTSSQEQVEVEAEDCNELTVIEDTDEEGVIYVTYQLSDDQDTPPGAHSPAPYHLVHPPHEHTVQSEEESSEVVVEAPLGHKLEHMPVTDELGNPLHFTMQDGTRLAITSLDGHSLHVITQDGQTIPVEINGITPDDES